MCLTRMPFLLAALLAAGPIHVQAQQDSASAAVRRCTDGDSAGA